MSGRSLDGKLIRDQILSELAPRIESLWKQGWQPTLAVVLIGDNPASEIYVRNKVRTCKEVGIRSVELRLPGHLTTTEVLQALKPLRDDDTIDGVLVQMPLSPHLDTEAIVNFAVPAERDVDGFGEIAMGRLVLNKPGIRSCTPAGIMEMLRRYQIGMAGRHAVVVGRSDIVGKPMALLLLHANATVTVCHSRTADLAAECKRADLLIAALGRPAFLDSGFIKPGAVVVDVGINRITDPDQARRLYQHEPARLHSLERTGSVLVGDVDPAAAMELSSAYTPVPGGVGPLTIAMLMANTVTIAEKRCAG